MKDIVWPSSLGRIARCERHGIEWRLRKREPRLRHVGAWVGEAVHAKLAGQAEPDEEALRCDDITPSLAVARRQVARMAESLRRNLEVEQINPLEFEYPFEAVFENEGAKCVVRGYADIVAATPFNNVVADLKTGRGDPGVWLQLGLTAGCLQQEEAFEAPVQCVLIRCPRVKLDRPLEIHFEFREAHDLYAPAVEWAGRAAQLQNGAAPMISPGQHCVLCPSENCPVRAYECKE